MGNLYAHPFFLFLVITENDSVLNFRIWLFCVIFKIFLFWYWRFRDVCCGYWLLFYTRISTERFGWGENVSSSYLFLTPVIGNETCKKKAKIVDKFLRWNYGRRLRLIHLSMYKSQSLHKNLLIHRHCQSRNNVNSNDCYSRKRNEP